MRKAVLLSIALLLAPAEAVDRSKFRTCNQGSFCRRFKGWMERPNVEETTWYVVENSREATSDGGFTVALQHKEEAAPHLVLVVNAYASGMIRLRLNEIDPVFPRYVIPAGDAVTEPPPLAAKVEAVSDATQTRISFSTDAGDKVSADLRHSPLRLEVSVNGRVVQRFNARNFLNFERYRRPQEKRPPDANNGLPGADSVTLDSAQNLHAKDPSGLWEESFGGHKDTKPRGPASFGVDVTFEGDVPAVYGLPEHAIKAKLPFYDEPYRFFNLDVFEYELDNPMALYGTIPMMWAIHRGGDGQPNIVSGFLWMAPSETFVKLARPAQGNSVESWWVSESGVMDATIFVGSTPSSVSRQFHALTGLAPLPPLWALGKHQCRWNYQDEKDVATVDASYDAHDLPYDVIWLDIEHTDGKAYFSWHKDHFPTPQQMTDGISVKNRKMVLVVDPHMKKSDSFEVYNHIKREGLFMKKVDWKHIDDPRDQKPEDWVEIAKIADPNATKPGDWSEDAGEWSPPEIDNPAYKGQWKVKQIVDPNSPQSDFEGWCWPGTSLYPDFTDPKLRKYWGSRFALDKYKGTNKDTYVWNDMNEPSVFNGPEVTAPRDAVHPHGNVEHRDVHNMYGYYVHRATFEGLESRSPEDRPFVLTRSFFVGSHKYCAIWTGDNAAEWGHIGVSLPMVGALNLGGQALVGADVGGFFKHPDAEMVTRWYQVAALTYGFFRNHAHLETPRREPYKYDEKTMERVKASLQLRYQMLPLWYTVFEEYHRLGHPVTRHLWWNFLDDAETHADEDATENELMLGDVALVYGVSKQGQTEANVYLPMGAGWYGLHDGTFWPSGKHVVKLDMETIPAFYRAGAIVPLKKRVRRSAGCMAEDPLTLNVYLDPKTGHASGRVYLDDYSTKAYQDGKSFLDVEFQFKDGKLDARHLRGSNLPTDVAATVERVEIFGLSKQLSSAKLDDGSAGVRDLTLTAGQPPSGVGAPRYFSAVLKVVPFLDLRTSTWSIDVD